MTWRHARHTNGGMRQDESERILPWTWVIASAFLVGFVLTGALLPEGPDRAVPIALLFPLAPAFAALAAVLASRASQGKRARMWGLVAVSMTSFWLAAVYRAITVIQQGHFPRAGTLEDALFLFGLSAMIPVVLLMTDPFDTVSLRKLRNMIDLASMVVLVLGVTVVLVFGPLGIVSAEQPLARSVVFLSYPTAASAFVLYLLAFKRKRWRKPDALLAAGFMSAAAGAMLAIAFLDSYDAGTDLALGADSLVVTCFLLIGLAATHAAARPETATTRVTPEFDLPRWPSAIATAGALLGIPAVILFSPSIADPIARALTSGSAALLTLFVIARSAVVTYENRQLVQQSIFDPLTGVFNQRYFQTRIAEESHEAARLGTELTVCVLDIDDFDTFNRLYGYREGDRRLQEIARIVQKASEHGGLTFRTAGDEFALLLASRTKNDALVECGRIALEVRSLRSERTPASTLSVGIASLPSDTPDPDSVLRLASGAAYWASSRGGDRIIEFDPAVVGALDSKEHVFRLERESHDRLVEAFAAAVDARDPYTRNHSANVARLSETLARAVGLDEERIHLVRAAALLHDVGKIGVPDAILGKVGPLDAEESALIQEHPVLGIRILQASVREEMLPWIEHHHERWDGDGYPAGLAGEDIPLEARILTVCDAYDAMTTDRPYKHGLSVSEAVDELARCSGSQFDPALVDAFLETLVSNWPETR